MPSPLCECWQTFGGGVGGGGGAQLRPIDRAPKHPTEITVGREEGCGVARTYEGHIVVVMLTCCTGGMTAVGVYLSLLQGVVACMHPLPNASKLRFVSGQYKPTECFSRCADS